MRRFKWLFSTSPILFLLILDNYHNVLCTAKLVVSIRVIFFTFMAFRILMTRKIITNGTWCSFFKKNDFSFHRITFPQKRGLALKGVAFYFSVKVSLGYKNFTHSIVLSGLQIKHLKFTVVYCSQFLRFPLILQIHVIFINEFLLIIILPFSGRVHRNRLTWENKNHNRYYISWKKQNNPFLTNVCLKCHPSAGAF